MLEQLAIPRSCWRSFLLCELFSVSGWASYIRYRGWKPGAPAKLNDDLIGLLAIRLAYDTALARIHDDVWPSESWVGAVDLSGGDPAETLAPPMDVVARYCVRSRRNLCTSGVCAEPC